MHKSALQRGLVFSTAALVIWILAFNLETLPRKIAPNPDSARGLNSTSQTIRGDSQTGFDDTVPPILDTRQSEGPRLKRRYRVKGIVRSESEMQGIAVGFLAGIEGATYRGSATMNAGGVFEFPLARDEALGATTALLSVGQIDVLCPPLLLEDQGGVVIIDLGSIDLGSKLSICIEANPPDEYDVYLVGYDESSGLGGPQFLARVGRSDKAGRFVEECPISDRLLELSSSHSDWHIGVFVESVEHIGFTLISRGVRRIACHPKKQKSRPRAAVNNVEDPIITHLVFRCQIVREISKDFLTDRSR